MKGSRCLRYVKADQVKADGIALRSLPLAVAGESEPIGRVDGVLVDLAARRVRYLVVEGTGKGQKVLMPLDATTLDTAGRTLERVASDDLRSCQPFDPSMVDRYDDEAMVSLLFGRSAA